MNTSNLTFTANDQELVKNSGLEEYASNSVSYIKATFTLGENWSGFDSVRAVWSSYYNIISTVLDTNNSCLVPAEMLLHKSEVKVNLVGSIVENNVLTDRLTTFPIKALKVSADAKVNGTETAPVSPSQFEQFVNSVEEAAQSVTDYSYDSEAWAKGTRGGVAVPSTDETYHNNSKYYADQGAELSQEVTNLKSEISDLPFEIYNPNEVKNDYYLNASGDEAPMVGWSITDYLQICESAVYYIRTETTSSAVFCWFYDKNKTKISSFQTSESGTHTLTAPSEAKFVRFSVMTSETADFTYESQILLPYRAVHPTLIEGTTMESSYEDEVYMNLYYTASGQIDGSENWALLPLYRVNEGDVFYMNYPFYQYITCFDEDKRFVSAQNAPENGEPVTYTIPSGVAFIGVSLLKARLGTFDIKLNGQLLGARYKIAWLNGSIWENKSYISHGDSITWQDGEAYIQGEHVGEIAKGYQTVFAENVNLSRKFNYGKSGWSMAVVNGRNGIVNAIIQIGRYDQFDLCTIACGTNDFKLNVPLGSLGVIGDTSFDATTFFGAYRKAVEYILDSSPTIRLVLMTPLQRDNSGYDVNYTNSAGHKLIDYVNAVKAVGEMYGLPVCDMYANSGFTKKTLSTYTMDGLHPNDVGYKRMGDYLTGFLNAIGN